MNDVSLWRGWMRFVVQSGNLVARPTHLKRVMSINMRRLSLGDVSRAILERDGEVKFLAKVKKSVAMVGEELLLSETYEELGMEEMRGTLGWSNRRRVALDDLRKRCVVEDMRLVRVNELSDEEWHELGVSWIGDLKWLAVKKYIQESLYCEFEEDMRLWEIKVRMLKD